MSDPVLIVGATRGLGSELAKQYARLGRTVYGTSRDEAPPTGFPPAVKWLLGVDLMKPSVGDTIAGLLNGVESLESVIITAGFFHAEDFTIDKGPDWEDQLQTYTTSSVAPVFIVHRLMHGGLLHRSAKIVLVSSEAGSIALRHEKEGGGNYAHHASKAALNMVGRLLSLDLYDRGIIVSIVHPGFMRTEMTKGVGYDQYWDSGGAVTPDVAAASLIDWTERLGLSKSGQFWAPRGPRDIGTADVTLGSNLSTPLQLPW